MSTKIWQISQFCVDVKAKLEDFVNFFCGLLGKYKAYPKRKVHKPHVMKKKIRGGRGSKTVDFETALFMEGPLVFYTAPQPRPGWPSPHQFGLAGAEKIVTDCWHERLFVETSQRCSTTYKTLAKALHMFCLTTQFHRSFAKNPQSAVRSRSHFNFLHFLSTPLSLTSQKYYWVASRDSLLSCSTLHERKPPTFGLAARWNYY